jgi:hypothetical protein
MFSKRMSRIAQTALIATLCLAPMAQARVLSGEREDSRPVASRMQDREGVVLTLWHRLVSLLEKNGNSIDPNGQQGTSNGSGVGTNEGASIDPSGAPLG